MAAIVEPRQLYTVRSGAGVPDLCRLRSRQVMMVVGPRRKTDGADVVDDGRVLESFVGAVM